MNWIDTRFLAVFAAGVMLGILPLAAAWYGGGAFDGYDQVRGTAAPDYPQVHNATGAIHVTEFSATLTGMLTATGSAPARVVVYWSQSDGGRDAAAWSTAPGGHHHEFGSYGDVALFDSLSLDIAVTQGKTYYYRFFATNTAGESGWAPESAVFATPSPPAVSTGAGAGAGITAAVLNGALTAGIEADLWLDWGKTGWEVPPASYATFDLGRRSEAGTLDLPNPFRITLDDLTAETTYAYRIRADNEFGQTTSPWVWFTTRPANFIITPDIGWSGGGAFDGYDRQSTEDASLPGFQGGTLMMLR